MSGMDTGQADHPSCPRFDAPQLRPVTVVETAAFDFTVAVSKSTAPLWEWLLMEDGNDFYEALGRSVDFAVALLATLGRDEASVRSCVGWLADHQHLTQGMSDDRYHAGEPHPLWISQTARALTSEVRDVGGQN